MLWQVNDRDGLGRVTDESLGTDNALSTKRTFWSNSGRLKTVQSGTAALPTSLQNDSYGWDDMGSLASRSNQWPSNPLVSETFVYDQINRVKQSTVTAWRNTSPTTRSVSMIIETRAGVIT